MGGLTLEKTSPQFDRLTPASPFRTPVSLGGPLALSVAAGAHASFKIVSDAADLPGEEPPDSGSPNTCYAAFGFEATVSSGLGGDLLGSLQFSAPHPPPRCRREVTRDFQWPESHCLRRFRRRCPSLFHPGEFGGDLADLAAGQIAARVAVSGKLTLSGSVDLLATTNPLASAGLPAPLPAVSVSAGSSATVGVLVDLETEYEVVARKLDSGSAVWLGVGIARKR